MYWFDIMLIAQEYQNMVEESENNNKYKEDFERQKNEMTSKLPNINSSNMMSSLPSMSQISSGFKMPSL